MAILDGLTDIPTKIGELGRELAPLTGFAGFMYGVDAKWKHYNPGSYPYSTTGVLDMVAQIAGKNVAQAISPSYNGAADRTLNIGAIMNKGSYAAVGVWGLHELFPNKWTKLLKDVALPPLAGYGIGRIFDDPAATNVDYTTPQNRNYAGGGFRAPLRGPSPAIAGMQRGPGDGWQPDQLINGWS